MEAVHHNLVRKEPAATLSVTGLYPHIAGRPAGRPHEICIAIALVAVGRIGLSDARRLKIHAVAAEQEFHRTSGPVCCMNVMLTLSTGLTRPRSTVASKPFPMKPCQRPSL